MFCDLNYRQDEGSLEGSEKDGETIFQRIRQRLGCEEKQAICLYTAGRRRRRSIFSKCNCLKVVKICWEPLKLCVSFVHNGDDYSSTLPQQFTHLRPFAQFGNLMRALASCIHVQDLVCVIFTASQFDICKPTERINCHPQFFRLNKLIKKRDICEEKLP